MVPQQPLARLRAGRQGDTINGDDPHQFENRQDIRGLTFCRFQETGFAFVNNQQTRKGWIMPTQQINAPRHKIASREEWTTARLALLKQEKELTRRSDEVARRRQELPWVRIDKNYQFDTDKGRVSLAEL